MLNANKLKGKMLECGYNQKTLAKELKISENTLRSRLSLRTSFTIEEADAICKLLDVTTDKEKARIFFATSGTKM